MGPTGSPGVPCASCVDDASVADRTVRLSLACEPEANNAPPSRGTAGWTFSSGTTGGLACRLSRPLDVVTNRNAVIHLVYTALRGTTSQPWSVEVRPLTPGVTPPAAVTRTASTDASVSTPVLSTHSFTVTELFGGSGAYVTLVRISPPSIAGILYLAGTDVEYTATR